MIEALGTLIGIAWVVFFFGYVLPTVRTALAPAPPPEDPRSQGGSDREAASPDGMSTIASAHEYLNSPEALQRQRAIELLYPDDPFDPMIAYRKARDRDAMRRAQEEEDVITKEELECMMGRCAPPRLTEPEVVVIPEAPPVFFKSGEPTTFEEYDGQPHVTDYLRKALQALQPTEQAIEPQLLLGLAGLGKTLLAKVVANELVVRAQHLNLPTPKFFEVFPADIEGLPALDEIMQRVIDAPGSVLFIDEVHDLQGPLSRKLYSVLQDGRFLFHGAATPELLPPTTLIAATTDYGALHPALKRRWHKHFLKPATPEQLVGYVMRRPYKIVQAAAEAIVARTKFSGAPWEALELYREAVTCAKARRVEPADITDVEWAFGLQEVDELGLRWLDREVIRALLKQPKTKSGVNGPEFICYAASEHNVCMLAGVDKEEYRETIRPRLMSRGLLEVRPYHGQALTPAAVARYGALLPAD